MKGKGQKQDIAQISVAQETLADIAPPSGGQISDFYIAIPGGEPVWNVMYSIPVPPGDRRGNKDDEVQYDVCLFSIRLSG